MDQYEHIRTAHRVYGKSIRGIRRETGHHRQTIRKALAGKEPKYRRKKAIAYPVMDPVAEVVEKWLREDRDRPRKQRHTAHRIWQRLKSEISDFDLSERTIRKYVRKRKLALRLIGRETCVPQSYPWASEGQVDWYEAHAYLGGELTCLQIFEMRSMASGGSFHRAYLRATQQAFLEAHELAFARFGGVFKRLCYDNLKAAVKKILQGHRREETARFVAFRSHWRFESLFCNRGIEHAHEKGGIEGEGGYFRRNHLVPVPHARDLEDLNEQLLAACYEDEQRRIAGREMTVGQAVLIEKEHLLPLAEEAFDLAEVSFDVGDLVPGRHVVKVNGMEKEIMIHSKENIYFLFSLSALPVALTTLIFRKFS